MNCSARTAWNSGPTAIERRSRSVRSVHERGQTAPRTLQTLIGRFRNGEIFKQTLAYRFDIGLVPGGHEIQQTIEGVLNLAADHVDVGHGKLRIHIIRMLGGRSTHLTHVGGAGTGQQQRLRAFASRAGVVRIGFQHLSVCAAAPA